STRELLRAVDMVEAWADGTEVSADSPELPIWLKWHPVTARNADDAANWTIRKACKFAGADIEKVGWDQVVLLREIGGNPFRRKRVPSAVLAWNEGLVPRLASEIYEERLFARMPILGDALEDAGCTDAEILGHCHDLGPHVRGCWVLDLILGKE